MRLLIVEDDDRVAAALGSVLSKHGFTVARARTAVGALNLLTTKPDLVLLDLGLPDRDGFEVCARIRAISNVPIIVVTARTELSARVHGLYLGADDYVVKPYDLRELLARIHAVVRRARPEPATASSARASAASAASASASGAAASTSVASPVGVVGRGLAATPGAGAAGARAVVETHGVRIDLDCRQVTVGGRAVELTRKEFDLLAELARAPGVVFRREQLVSEVWGLPGQAATRTLEVHVASLRGKLGEPRVVQTVRGVGYRLAAPG